MPTIALGVTLMLIAPLAGAIDIVVLSSGERMDVESFEIQKSVVVVKTWDGRLRALPIAYVDIAATESANEEASASDKIAPARLDKAKQACDAYRIQGAVANYRDALEQQIQKLRGQMSIAAFDQIRAAFRNAFDDERSFDVVVAHFARNANIELLDHWNEWLATPFAQQMVAMENDRLNGDETNDARRYYAKLSTDRAAYARRRELVTRLDDARHSTESGIEVVLYLIEAFFEAGRQIFPDEEIEYDPVELRRRLTPGMRRSQVEGMILLFRDASDDELESYIAYWTSVEGQRISDLVNAALEASAMQGSDVAMQILAGKRQTVP